MARSPIRAEEIVDSAALRRGLTALVPKSQGEKATLRPDALRLLKETHRQGLLHTEAMLREEGAGTLCASRISHLLDEIIGALHDYALAVTDAGKAVEREAMAVVAVGGFGRGTLAPGSDIDLLFLRPARQSAAGTQAIEFMLYMLWDMGLKVGHSTRTVDECLRQARADMTIRTAVLEARLICGERKLYDDFVRRFDAEIVRDSGAEFVQAKLAERDERHAKQGESRYKVEPNVKEGKGGLRDLHTLFWIAKYFYRVKTGDELVEHGVITRDEYRLFRHSEDFLWAARCHLHFLAGKAEERIHFDVQRELAGRLGYTANEGLKDVELFMRQYFTVAKNVGDLTRIFCAALEEEHAQNVPGFNRFFLGFSRRKRKLAGTSDFIVDNQRINVADDGAFERDPVNIVRLFWFADKHQLEYHPHALRLLTRSLRLVDKKLRRSEEANRMFLECLTSQHSPELNLRRMNEAGLLGKLIPEFGKIVAMMQFSMYHHYTVDEHLLRCIGVLSELEHGVGKEAHPLVTKLLPSLKDQRTVLYAALLLHDIAKGRPEHHSIAGARIARKVCPAMGLSSAQTETVSWLVEQHLLMSETAQSRDLNDRKTIQDFANIVQSVERLKLLLVLTVCDIRGVGPGVWNGWKGQLLRTLYHETELLLTGGFSEQSRKERGKQARELLSQALTGWDDKERADYVDLHYDNYMITVSPDDQVRHAHFLREATRADRKFATMVKTHAFEGVTEITVLAQDHPRLLSIIAGACAAAGANIVDAQIFTTWDGRALDTILITREFDRDEDELRRANTVSRVIEDVLSGKAYVHDIVARRAKPKRGAKAFSIEPRCEIDNQLSRYFSVIEVEGLDRPGLLWEITATISDLSLDIASAHITTYGEKVIDAFYVKDLVGQKVTDPARQARIRKRIIAVLSGEAEDNAKRGGEAA
jgi:[protein-PII] uridylyltransferase